MYGPAPPTMVPTVCRGLSEAYGSWKSSGCRYAARAARPRDLAMSLPVEVDLTAGRLQQLGLPHPSGGGIYRSRTHRPARASHPPGRRRTHRERPAPRRSGAGSGCPAWIGMLQLTDLAPSSGLAAAAPSRLLPESSTALVHCQRRRLRRARPRRSRRQVARDRVLGRAATRHAARARSTLQRPPSAHVRAARVERAARRQVDQARRAAGDRHQVGRPASPSQRGHRAEQAPGVRVLRAASKISSQPCRARRPGRRTSPARRRRSRRRRPGRG